MGRVGSFSLLPQSPPYDAIGDQRSHEADGGGAGALPAVGSGGGGGDHVWVAWPADWTATVSATLVVAATAGGMGATAGRALRPPARDGAARAREQLTRRGGAA